MQLEKLIEILVSIVDRRQRPLRSWRNSVWIPQRNVNHICLLCGDRNARKHAGKRIDVSYAFVDPEKA